MSKLKVALMVLVAVAATGCACRTHRIDDNIGMAEEGSILKDVNFAFDSYKIDEAGKAVVAKNAEWLTANPSVKIDVEGHCDERGTNEYNMVLGQNRARATFDALKGAGIAADRMNTISYGEEQPLDPGHNEAAFAKNRRAHLRMKK